MWKDGFFSNVLYGADDFARYFSCFIGDGVVPKPFNNMMVVEGDGMTVYISPGAAVCKGRYAYNSNDFPITVDIGDGTLDRLDRIVLRLDLVNDRFTPIYLKGVADVTPVAPSLLRNGSYYDLCIATISVVAGATTITQADITDDRPYTDLCGWATMLPGEFDTTGMFAQIQSEWDNIKGKLSEDPAGHLLELVTAAQETADEALYKAETSIDLLYLVCPDGYTTAPNSYYIDGGSSATRFSTWILQKAIIPPSVTHLPINFLRAAPTLVEVYGENVSESISGLLQGAELLKTVTLPNLTTAMDDLLRDCSSLTEVSLPSLTTVRDWLLASCGSLTEVSLPNLTTARDRLLASCSSLTEVSLPSLTTAGDSLLSNCGSLTEVSLPNLTTAGGALLNGCTSLTEVSLPNLTTVGNQMLQNCPLESLTVGGENTLTLTSSGSNNYSAWKLPVTDMVAFGMALKPSATTITIIFKAEYYNALSPEQKAIFTGKNYTISTV